MAKHLLLFALSLSTFSFSQSEVYVPCSHCTSIDDALEDPKRVKHLDLHALGLSEIPKEINLFINLKTLNLSENFIDEINFDTLYLPWLEELDLSKNPGFNTFALDGIGECSPQLALVNLSYTNCTSVSPELVRCEKIRSLDLGNNYIHFLPSQFGDLNNLEELNLENNQFKMLPFLDDLWGLKELNISGNDDLHLKQVGSSLMLKKPLENLIISTERNLANGVPNIFEIIKTEKLTIKNCSVYRLNNRLTRNTTLKTVVLDSVKLTNPKAFTAWLNRMENVQRIEYKTMLVPKGLDEVVSVDVMQFDYCTIEDKDELRKVKPSIKMIAHGTDISQGAYIGNAKMVNTANSDVSVTSDVIEMSQNMIDNTLEPIARQREQVEIIAGDTPCRVRTENTFLDIPSEAFLTQSGQLYTGEVKVVVKEYMDPIENALTSTPMTYRTNAGNELFSSSGMIDFRAYDNSGNELQPNPESVIEVQMNDLQPSESPNFYSFDEESNNWEAELPPLSSRIARRKRMILDSLNKVSAKELTGFQHVPVFVGLHYKKSRKDPYQLSFSIVEGKKVPLRKIQNFTPFIRTSNPDQAWIASRNTWKIDTILTDDTKDLLKRVKKSVRYVRRSWGDEPFSGSYVVPRVIHDLTIAPNLKNDNYTLSFKFEDTVRQIPVIPSFGGSIRRIQKKERNNFKSYQLAEKAAQKEAEMIERYENTVLEKYAKTLRVRKAEALAIYPDWESSNREYLRFGLTSFGLVNCDYFYRNTPDGYIAFDTVGVDEEGRTFNVPIDVRNVYVDDNVFVSTSSLQVPVYKKKRSILFFLISPLEIAIIKGWEKLKDGFCQPKVKRISISTTDTPEDIKRKILAAEV